MIYNEGYSPGPQPHHLVIASGCRVWDRDGSRGMIDLSMGCGSMILGHTHPVAVEEIRRQCNRGTIYTAPHAGTYALDNLLDKFIPWLPGRVWCNSGSEAIMRLVRIARAVTGKPKIGLFSGCWHGSWDGTLVEEDYEAKGCNGTVAKRLKSAGLPEGVCDSIVFLPYNDYAAMTLIREHVHELACVLIEPVQGSNPRDDVRPFLTGLRHTCSDSGVLLAMDEVVTGFRLAPGGGQAHFRVHADLAAYGKVLGGGLPVGMVAGTKAIMDEARRRGVFYGGTFSANPLTIAAGLATLKQLRGGEVYSQLEAMGSLLRSNVNHACLERDLPVRMIGCNSISRLLLTTQPVRSRRERDQYEPALAAQDRFYATLRDRGLHIGTNRILFLSTAHGVAEVTKAADTIMDAAGEFNWKE